MTSRNVCIPRRLCAVAASIVAEQRVVGWLLHLISPQWMHDARDVQEMAVVEIVRDAVAAPRAEPHRERKRQRLVVAASGCETVRLINDHAANRKRMS